MNEIKLPQLAADKANHVITGYVISFIGTNVAHYAFGAAPDVSSVAGTVLAALAGATWEGLNWYWNKHGADPQHDVSGLDLGATVCGGLANSISYSMGIAANGLQ